ncbi:MAG: helix-turn-helix domain-containing protein [Chloroflexi bacterium]|nr:helix-turn-helix domain-containing protein [Chloroflexota bacterium]
MKDFGKRLSEIRESWGKSQEEVANGLGVHHQTVSNWELGKSTPNVIQLRDICLYFRCSADSLLRLPIENTNAQIEEGSGLKWRVTRPALANLSRSKEIDDAIEVFRLIAKEKKGFLEIQEEPKFAGYGETKLRHLVKVALFSTAIQLSDVERNGDKEKKLLNLFRPNLRKCIVAKTTLVADQLIDSTIRTEAVAFLAARDALSSLPNIGDVGLTGGNTIARFVDLLPPASPDLRGITWVPILVTREQERMERTALSANSVITRLLYNQPGAKGFRLPFLEVHRRSSEYLANASDDEKGYIGAVHEVIDRARKVSVAFLSIGTPEYEWQITDAHMGLPPLNHIFQNLSPEEKEECVGDVLLTLVDKHGKRLGSQTSRQENDKLVYSIELNHLQKVARFGTVWVLAARSQPGKANVIRGALQEGLINSLVIDTTVADMLLADPT